eukprot:4036342-Pleurochrysis_carterae.AAC.1
MPAAQLLALSNGMLPGVLAGETRREGGADAGLFMEGVPAELVPLRGKALRDATGLALQGGEPKRLQLDTAMTGLGLAWAALDGAARGGPRKTATRREQAEALDEVWLLGRSAQPATWRRLATLRALGVSSEDHRPLDTARAADFLAGVADAVAESGHVALARRRRRRSRWATARWWRRGDPCRRACGHDCVMALVAVLDALGPEGEAKGAAVAYIPPPRHPGCPGRRGVICRDSIILRV